MKVFFFTGYIGLTAHYHTIELVPEKIKISIPSAFNSKQPKVVMLSPRRKFFKKHKSTKSNERTRRNKNSNRSF